MMRAVWALGAPNCPLRQPAASTQLGRELPSVVNSPHTGAGARTDCAGTVWVPKRAWRDAQAVQVLWQGGSDLKQSRGLARRTLRVAVARRRMGELATAGRGQEARELRG